jgi:TfoX/Sxy family transcriptional regulator of competence genes
MMPKSAKSTKKPQPQPDVDPRFARIANAFVKDQQVTYGKMFASMGLKVNGKIFAMFAKGSFVAKLPKERVDDLVRRGTGTYFDPGHGRLMKEWVALERADELWLDLAREARRFVGRAKE